MKALRRFFGVFDEGIVFKWIVVGLFVLEALLLLIFGVRSAYGLLRMLGDVKFLAGLGAVILVLGLLLATLLALAIVGYRGVYEVAKKKAERYSPLALWAKVLRVNGEATLFYLLVLGPAGCLATWLSSGRLARFLPFPPAFMATGTFSLGLAVLLGGILYAALIVFVAYLVAEVFELLPAVAADVTAIRAAKGSKK